MSVSSEKDKLNEKINNQKYAKQQYELEKSQYEKCLVQAQKLKSQLLKISSKLSEVIVDIKLNFTIENKPGDNGAVKLLNEEITNEIKKLNEIIIPNINSRISELSRKISNANYQINSMRNEINELK